MYVLASEKFVGFAAWGNGPGGSLLVTIHIMAFNPEATGLGLELLRRTGDPQQHPCVLHWAIAFFRPKKCPLPAQAHQHGRTTGRCRGAARLRGEGRATTVQRHSVMTALALPG